MFGAEATAGDKEGVGRSRHPLEINEAGARGARIKPRLA